MKNNNRDYSTFVTQNGVTTQTIAEPDGYYVKSLNPTNGDYTEFKINPMNAMVQYKKVTTTSTTDITYKIDAENKRAAKFVNGIFHSGFLYDKNQRLIATLNNQQQIEKRFIYATQDHSPDYMIHFTTSGPVNYYFAKNYQGSIRRVVNALTGTNAQIISTDEFGRPLSDSNPGFQPFSFAGGHFDTDTNTLRFGARDYNPVQGRWLIRDPIFFNGGQSNLLVYVNNDPVNFIDPSGLAQCYYNASTGNLSCQSNDGNRQYSSNAFSGGNGFSSIPTGNYSIRTAQGWPNNFYSLSRGRFMDLLYMGSKGKLTRGGFMMHPGNQSEGCITIRSKNEQDMRDYNNISDLIDSELGDSTLEVIGGP